MRSLLTVGHGIQPIESFLDLLRGAGISRVADVRLLPQSRRNPQFGRGPLAASLAGAGIAYEHARDLGGMRQARPGSPHIALAENGFRGYADHMDTPEFRAAAERLLATLEAEPTAVMCAEGLPDRCHRRFLSDAVVARGFSVEHLLPDGTRRPHVLHPAARRLPGGGLVYDGQAVQGRLL